MHRSFCFLALLGSLTVAQAATISGPTGSGGPGEDSGSSLNASDQSNPLGFDVTGTLSLLGFSAVPYSETVTITRDVTLTAGLYQIGQTLEGSASSYTGSEDASLTVSTELDVQGTSTTIPGSYVQSSGTYDTATNFNITDQQPGSEAADFLVPTTTTYTLTQTIVATVAESTSSTSGSANIGFDFTQAVSSITPSSTPEPATLSLLGLGAGFILYRGLRKR